ncbi:hypothetical protein NDI44_11400 [Trichocoleus sp. DQ-A3]|uniref:hypothetical protein n=1 Tax=Cyanophyceae TaxID=3028117 RepID=UPI00168A18BC|nr:hypothetical protein [Coleofasciculus sp. FACHB-125]MBD1902701.1 hypothetical protein [Coleofasciculus sp. FACHB-125]
MKPETPVFSLFVVDKRKSTNYQELRGFVPKTLSLKFKGICKSLGQDINVGLEEAIANWIEKQQQQEDSPLSESSGVVAASTAPLAVPTIASLIDETLSNRDWVLGKLAADAEIAVERINELLEGDRASDVELQKLAQRLVKLNGEAWEEGELVDIRLAEDLKRRRQQKRSS